MEEYVFSIECQDENRSSKRSSLGVGQEGCFSFSFLGKYHKKLNDGQDFSVVSMFTACFFLILEDVSEESRICDKKRFLY